MKTESTAKQDIREAHHGYESGKFGFWNLLTCLASK
jgi:hypothetical protein